MQCDVRRDNPAAYQAGVLAQRTGAPPDPPTKAEPRIAYWDGWYDAWFYPKYGAPWPDPDTIT
jgi:hypothetical protein